MNLADTNPTQVPGLRPGRETHPAAYSLSCAAPHERGVFGFRKVAAHAALRCSDAMDTGRVLPQKPTLACRRSDHHRCLEHGGGDACATRSRLATTAEPAPLAALGALHGNAASFLVVVFYERGTARSTYDINNGSELLPICSFHLSVSMI
jgi:hypothetical protein